MGHETVEHISLPKWLPEKCVIVAWVASFGILILLAFFTFIPVAVTMDDSSGNCLLYANFKSFGPLSVCNYCIACAVIFLFLCSLRLILLLMKVTRFASRITDRIYVFFSIWGVHFLILCLDVVLLVLLLVTACLLSAGLSSMCHNIYQGRRLCSPKEGVYLRNVKMHISFYTALTFAEVSAWLTLIYWLIITAVQAFLLWENGSLRKVVDQLSQVVYREEEMYVHRSVRSKRDISGPVAV